MPTPFRAAITGVASFHPNRVVTNQDLEKIVDTTDEWIKTRTGIKERHFVDKGVASSDMATQAVKKLLKTTGTSPDQIELIIVGTVTPDMLFPATACLIQRKIGAKNCWGFDLLGACSGFVYALSVGEQFIRTGKHKKVVVIGVDTMSSIINFKDRNSCVLFGDGAGAVLLEPTSEENNVGILDNVNHIDGTGGEFLYMPAGGSLNPTTFETVEKKMHFVHQEGKAVYKYAVSEMANVSEEILKKNNLGPKDIALFVAHQANLRIVESTQKRLGLPDEKVMVTIDKYANTTAATIPTCLDVAVEQKRLKKGDLVLIAAFGAGFTWGATLVRWAY